MATKIILKKSSTVGAVPLSTDLEIGEVAVNLVDRKKKKKNNSGNIIKLDSAYVSTVAPGSPAEGDLWYDSANHVLKAFNGATWITIGALSTLSFNSSTGVLTATNYDGTQVTTNLDGRYSLVNHTHTSASISNFDEAVLDTVASGLQGSGIVSVNYLDASNLITISAVESDTLDSVTTRGSVTSNDITVNNFEANDGQFNGNVIISGDLIVSGVTTTINSNEVNIGDAIILLNADEVGAPTQNAGFEVKRGTETNVTFLWDETNDVWSLANQTLANVRLDGGTY